MQTGARPTASSPAPSLGALPRRAFQPSDRIGADWRLVHRAKRGAVFEVWRGCDIGGAYAAVKLPRPSAEREELARALLRRERDCLMAVRHAHIVAPRAFIDAHGHTALVTEWLGGGDLVSLAGARPRHWVGALRAVTVALRHLHAVGYVHRDVKARNVLFDAQDRVRLIDFASAARIGARVPSWGVTPAHRRPDRPSARAMCDDDAYALATLIYELWTGRLPRGIDGRRVAVDVPAKSGEAGYDRVLDWALRWLDSKRPARASDIGTLATVLDEATLA